MGIVSLNTVWILLLALTGSSVQSAGPPITCVAGTFEVGEAASITCNFRTDVSTTHRSINMARYPWDAPKGAIGEDVLPCRWSEEKMNYDCIIEDTDGYRFDGVITDQVTVTIPAVNFEHAALYMCFFVPSDGIDAHPCELQVKERPKTTAEKLKTTTESPMTTRGMPKTTREIPNITADKTAQSQDMRTMILLCFLLTAAVAGIVAISYFLCKRSSKSFQKNLA